MTREFKIALLPYLFDGGLVTYMLQNLPRWPEIDTRQPYDDEEEENFLEPLDTENCEFVDFTDDTLIISCGGNWQEPHTLTVGFFEDMGYIRIGVIDVEKSELYNGIGHREFEELFEDVMEFLPKPVKPLAQLVRELDSAVDDEDYETAAKLRDEIKDRKTNL